jgi:hypothetical protein
LILWARAQESRADNSRSQKASSGRHMIGAGRMSVKEFLFCSYQVTIFYLGFTTFRPPNEKICEA